MDDGQVADDGHKPDDGQILDDKVPAEDVMDILVATDIHLGYEEKDPERGNSTFFTPKKHKFYISKEKVYIPMTVVLSHTFSNVSLDLVSSRSHCQETSVFKF